tara:strand:+ start:363 stop:476 length:114 start_codon:yes stop_codon:yes gene_type:complete
VDHLITEQVVAVVLAELVQMEVDHQVEPEGQLSLMLF